MLSPSSPLPAPSSGTDRLPTAAPPLPAAEQPLKAAPAVTSARSHRVRMSASPPPRSARLFVTQSFAPPGAASLPPLSSSDHPATTVPLRRVATFRPPTLPAAAVSRAAYEKAGADAGPRPAGDGQGTHQARSGGRLGSSGRPVNTRRDTWKSLGQGMLRAVCAGVVNAGVDPLLRRCRNRAPADEEVERVRAKLASCAGRYYRGEVWALRYVFGTLSRFINGVTDVDGRSLTPTIVTTWFDASGVIRCSCVKRVAFSARLRLNVGDAECEHGRTLRAATITVCKQMGVPLATFRTEAAGLVSNDPASMERTTKALTDEPEDWDAEGPMEVFRTGQSAVSVVVTGTGVCKVAAPVRCALRSTHCAFCDSAAGFSCLHAVRSRSVRVVKKDRCAEAGSSDEDVAVDDARSSNPIPLYNCPRSVRADIRARSLMEEGNVLELEAPASCPTCGNLRAESKTKEDKGELLCSTGYCAMKVHSFYCDGKECERWVFPDGTAAGIVMLSATTAGTSVLMRGFAREMSRYGTTISACINKWSDDYMDLRDSGAHPNMHKSKKRSRMTINSLFWLAVELMVKDPPLWAFKCSRCQDKAGRWRIVTADGIWLGFLKRLLSGKFTVPWEDCGSSKKLVDAASIHPSEWVRRFIRGALKQPARVVVLKAGHLNSAMRALAFLVPEALPAVTEEKVSDEKRAAMADLRALLAKIWDLDHACLSLCDGINVHLKKLLGPRCPLSADEVAAHQKTLQDLYNWSCRVRGAPVNPLGGEAGPVAANAQGENAGGAPLEPAAPGPAAAPGDVAVAGVAVVQEAVVRIMGGPVPGPQAAQHGPAGAANDSGEDGLVGKGAARRDGAGGEAVQGGNDAGVGGDGEAVGAAEGPDAGAGDQLPVGGDAVAGGPQQGAPAAAGVGGGGGVGAAGRRAGRDRVAAGGGARGPAASARRHHMDRSTNEPFDPRCLCPAIKVLGPSVYKDILSLALSLAIDPAVNAFKPRHCDALASLAGTLRGDGAADALNAMLLDATTDTRAPSPDADAAGETVTASRLLWENRMLSSFCVAVSGSPSVFADLQTAAAGALDAVRLVVREYHDATSELEKTWRTYQSAWGDASVSPATLRARFLESFPKYKEDPRLTGCWFPGLARCRPGAFGQSEDPELGTCRKNYEDVHKFFSPGTFTICCACAHPKVIGFIVLDKREGPPALLNALLSYFALLPLFVVYDFGCGALRSALGKLPWMLAVLVFVSDLFHIVNHLCGDALHPSSYTGLDGANSVAHEQRNAPINRMQQTLRACGQDEYTAILQLENLLYNVMAQARSTSAYPLHDSYVFRQYYFSRTPCFCGCGYNPPVPTVPTAPVAAPRHAAPVAAPAPAVPAPCVAAQLPLENQENGIEWPSDED